MWKYPKLSELAEYLNLDDNKTLYFAQKIFGDTDGQITFHDARFDTATMFLCCLVYKERQLGIDNITKLVTKTIRI